MATAKNYLECVLATTTIELNCKSSMENDYCVDLEQMIRESKLILNCFRSGGCEINKGIESRAILINKI